ncbi:hypothetical protein CEP54_005255 [Fusarium duplospermum]|uniref:Uncharacterized protein n=1 Tax=Fusarium duplospermum TaxID=1325734 RepID=A0A428QDN7_9HYPO|nr:hypothetical protein CEP54_005255 [Fusarium duplospermum]
MTADLPEVVSNTTAGDWKGIDGEYDGLMKALRKHFVRTDGMEPEPRDLICGMYSRLVNIDGSFRSNPPCLYALFFDEATSRSFERKMDDLEAKCEQDDPGYEGEECFSYIEALLLMQSTFLSDEIRAFYRQHLGLAQDPVGDVLMKPEMCGEGWKHGKKYIEMRQSMGAEAKSSPVIQLAV